MVRVFPQQIFSPVLAHEYESLVHPCHNCGAALLAETLRSRAPECLSVDEIQKSFPGSTYYVLGPVLGTGAGESAQSR